MKASQFLISTLKEAPADAEVISHQLMTRAGMIKKLGAGIYTYMPMGLRVIQKVEAIVREEMNRAGAIECLMPMVQPSELWRETGRFDKMGPELLRIKDRHERDFVLQPTSEEAVTDIARQEFKSYKQLPRNLYQIQTKFRDERRPRFGLMRGREFIMKDAYSFDRDEASARQSYQKMAAAYRAIFDRFGLTYRAVAADSGSIGGDMSEEFQVIAATGEDAIVFSSGGNYAANIEKAEAQRPTTPRPAPTAVMEKVPTPDSKTIATLVANHGVPIERTVKTLLVAGAEGGLVALILRGDHELNPIKAEHLPEVAAPLRMADEAEIRAAMGAGAGSLGPVGANVPVIVDYAAAHIADFAAGANEDDYHYFNINWERDVPLGKVADLRNIVEGDLAPDGSGSLSIRRGIEVGHIFQLGKKYSEAMGLKVQLEDGGSAIPLMGCYGIGVTRVVAAAIEQNHDERGIIWSRAIAPFTVAILPLNAAKSPEVMTAAEALYQKLLDAGVDVVLDDRGKRPGFMFADIDLIGIPARVVISDKTLANGEVEYKERRSDSAEMVLLDAIYDRLTASR